MCQLDGGILNIRNIQESKSLWNESVLFLMGGLVLKMAKGTYGMCHACRSPVSVLIKKLYSRNFMLNV